jgi:hypothetical protein
VRSIADRWYECEDGHVTTGGKSKAKCGAELWNLNYVKGKRKGSWVEEKTKVPSCTKAIVASGDIPDKMDYFSVWDYRTMHAFLMGQKFDAEFMIELQNAFCKLRGPAEKKDEPLTIKIA